MRTRIIHLINPKTDTATTRSPYMNRALYSLFAGLPAVAASTPLDQYEVVLTEENIETIDFDLKTDLVGISAMTSYVNRGYEIADQFRAEGVPVVIGGVHPSFMSQEALKHCDAVVIGEVELVIHKLLDDLKQGSMRGPYKSETLHPRVGMPMPRCDLLKKNRYVNRTYVQISRGCHQGCTFCAEPLMKGLKVPPSAGRRSDSRDGELRCAHHLDQRRRLFRYAGASEGSDARVEGTRHLMAGRRHLQTCAGRPHARACSRERLHDAEYRL